MKDLVPFKELPLLQKMALIVLAGLFSAYLILATYGAEIGRALSTVN